MSQLSVPMPTFRAPVEALDETGDITRADTGLGTLYERWALWRLLTKLQNDLGIRTVLEGPDDGMTGISGLNSMFFALNGAEKVTHLLPHPERAAFARSVWQIHAPHANHEILDSWDGQRLPFADNSFDLVWNFNVMISRPDPFGTLREMCRVSKKYVMIYFRNGFNYGFPIHRIQHWIKREPWDHGKIELMEPAPWRKMFRKLGLEVMRDIYMDAPWWPDIVDFSQLIGDFVPFIRPLTKGIKPGARLRYEPKDLPYFDWAKHPEPRERSEYHAFIEKTDREWLTKRFAHNAGVLAQKGDGHV